MALEREIACEEEIGNGGSEPAYFVQVQLPFAHSADRKVTMALWRRSPCN